MLGDRRCQGPNARDEPCGSPPLTDAEFCLMHSPEHGEVVAEARRLGGLRRRREVAVAGAYEFHGLATVDDLRRVVEIALLDTLELENSVKRSRTLGALVSVAARLLEVGELEQRLRIVEASVSSPALASGRP